MGARDPVRTKQRQTRDTHFLAHALWDACYLPVRHMINHRHQTSIADSADQRNSLLAMAAENGFAGKLNRVDVLISLSGCLLPTSASFAAAKATACIKHRDQVHRSSTTNEVQRSSTVIKYCGQQKSRGDNLTAPASHSKTRQHCRHTHSESLQYVSKQQIPRDGPPHRRCREIPATRGAASLSVTS